MAYFLRAFCTSGGATTLREVFQWSADQGVELQAPTVDLDTPDWQEAEITYAAERQPFIAERTTGEPLRAEVEEFIEFLEDAEDSPEKDKVSDHMRRSQVVVAVQLLGDIDEDGYTAATMFLQYFVDHSSGLIQADGEGFYEGGRLIIELE